MIGVFLELKSYIKEADLGLKTLLNLNILFQDADLWRRKRLVNQPKFEGEVRIRQLVPQFCVNAVSKQDIYAKYIIMSSVRPLIIR